MNFYESIVDFYEMIFPESPQKAEFVKSRFTEPEKLSLLDAGCATGKTAAALAESFKRVIGIDSDRQMIDKARKLVGKQKSNLQFLSEDMLNISRKFDTDSFEGISCFGNTLVHLLSRETIFDFIQQCRKLLKPEGKLLIQIINYDRILDNNIPGLPTIENEHIRFVRRYNYSPENGLINFDTDLLVKSEGRTLRNSVPLYPLRKSELEKALRDAGFEQLKFCGNFKAQTYTPESLPLIAEAE